MPPCAMLVAEVLADGRKGPGCRLVDELSIGESAEVLLAALYLDGAPRGVDVPKGRWREVLHQYRAEGFGLEGIAGRLRRRGFREEALALESDRLLEWSRARVRAGVLLTAASPEYPEPWRAKLGAGAPPALWRRGAMPRGPFLAVVGSRAAAPPARRFARDVGAASARLGYTVVSGGACGCDRAAASGASHVQWEVRRCTGEPVRLLEILPCGLNLRRERFAGAVLSPFAPDAPFTAAQAMIRNALIYALADAAVIVQARLGEGGSWRGAIEANRRKLCPLLVRESNEPASRALAGLGATPLRSPHQLQHALAQALLGQSLGI